MINLFQYGRFFLRHALLRKKMAVIRKKSVYEIDYRRLQEQGIRLLIYDADDTLCEHHEDLPERTKKLFRTLAASKAFPFHIAIISNSNKRRQERLSYQVKDFSIFVEKSANKPSPKGFLEILSHFQTKPEKAAVIGDRLGTDLFGAELAGIHHLVLIEPYSSIFGSRKAPFLIRVIRDLEKRFVF